MSDVTEPRSQPDKGGARPSPSRRAAPERGAPSAGLRSERTRNFSSLRKKSCASLPVGFFFFFLVFLGFFPRFPSPFFLLKVSFFFFSSLTAWLIQLQCQSTFFPLLFLI